MVKSNKTRPNKKQRLKKNLKHLNESFNLCKIPRKQLKWLKQNGVEVIKIKNINDNGYKLDLVRNITKTTLVINYQLEVLLFVFINDKHEYTSIPEAEVMKIREIKNNIQKKGTHNTISGESYGTGITRKYQVKNQASFGPYAVYGEVGNKEAGTINSVNLSIKILNNYLTPSFLFQCFKKIAFSKHLVEKKFNMRINNDLSQFLYNAVANKGINTQWHTDNDNGYSILISNRCVGTANFMFKNICEIDFSSYPSNVIFYASKILPHKQVASATFVNCGTYVQSALIQNINKSLQRVESKK